MISSTHLTRRVSVTAALGFASAVLAACASPAGKAAPATTVTVTVAPTSAQPPATSAAPATSAPASSPASSPAGPAPCPTRYLHVSLGLAQGAAGSTYQVIDFTNIGAVTCTLYGYPGVSLAGGTPVAQIGQAATEDPAHPRQLVTLAPGAVANALLQVVDAHNYSSSACHPAQSTYLQVYPPNQTTPTFVSYATTACAKAAVHLLTVSVVQPGSGG